MSKQAAAGIKITYFLTKYKNVYTKGRKTMKELYGVTIAMTTPFDGEGKVDVAAIEKTTDALIKSGSSRTRNRISVSARSGL